MPSQGNPPPTNTLPMWLQIVLEDQHHTLLLEHTEQNAQQINTFEQRITSDIITAYKNRCGEQFEPGKSLGIVVPYRQQRTLLRRIHPDLYDDIDTVERFQGSERDWVLLCATLSDPWVLQEQLDFLLDPNRLNVAISRHKYKLILLASRHIFRIIPAEVEDFERCRLWKDFASHASKPLHQEIIHGHSLSIFTPYNDRTDHLTPS